MRFIVKEMRDDRRIQRKYGVLDTVENVIVCHTNSKFNADTYAYDLNEELKLSC